MPNPKSANLDDQTLKRPKISSLSLSLVKPIQKPIDKHPEKLLAMAKSKKIKPVEKEKKPRDQPAPVVEDPAPPTISEQQPEITPQDFDSYYLKTVTLEFADDLDRVRNAGDFSDKSLPILITALKQGSNIYSEEEKRRVLEAQKL